MKIGGVLREPPWLSGPPVNVQTWKTFQPQMHLRSVWCLATASCARQGLGELRACRWVREGRAWVFSKVSSKFS